MLNIKDVVAIAEQIKREQRRMQRLQLQQEQCRQKIEQLRQALVSTVTGSTVMGCNAEEPGPKEASVMQLLLTCASTKEIGTALSMKPRTVKFHISNLLRRYQCTTRGELVAFLTRLQAAQSEQKTTTMQ